MRRDSNHGLTHKSLRKLLLMSKFISIFNFKLMIMSCTSLFSAVFLFYCAIAYIRQDFPMPLISEIVWSVILSFSAFSSSVVIVFTYSMIFFYTYYLCLRFRQLFDTFGTIDCQRLIESHSKLTLMTVECNRLFQYLITINHFISTLTLILTSYIAFYGRGVFFFRLAVGNVALFGLILMLMITRIAANLSFEAHRFYISVNSLATRMTTGLRHKLKARNVSDLKVTSKIYTHLKLSQFIEHLSGPTIGIYCHRIFAINSLQFFRVIRG